MEIVITFSNNKTNTIQYDTDCIQYADQYLSFYDVKPFNFVANINFAGNRSTNNINSTLISQTYRNNIKARIAQMNTAGLVDLSSDALNELNGYIDTMPIYFAPNAIGLTGIPIGTSISTFPIPKSIASPSHFEYGSALNDIWNDNDLNNWLNFNVPSLQSFRYRHYAQLPVLFNIFARAIDEGVIEPSEELSTWIDENLVPVVTDLSVKWDVYFDVKKEYLLINKSLNVLVRWSCDAINRAVEDYVQAHPDYLYRADNTVVWLKVTDIHARNFYDVANVLYGDLQYQTTVADLQQKAGIDNFVEVVGSFTPMTNLGDVCICCYVQFEDGTTSSVCIQQIPMNSLTTDVSKLYHKNGRDGSTITAHYGMPTEGVDDDVVGWNDEAYNNFTINDDFQTNDSSTDFSGTNGVNSNIGLLTDTYILTNEQLFNVGRKIWTGEFTSLIDTLNASPIENIISVKAFPFNISGGTSSEIVLGNVELGVNGNKLPNTFSPIKTIGTFTIPKPFTGKLEWLSYAPYSSIQMFLPYVGIVEIDPALVYDKQCTLKYIYDVICGNCQACLYVDDDVQHSNIELYKWNGELAIDIPITASNRVSQSVGYLTNGVNAVAQLFKGNVLGAAFGMLDTLTVPFKTTTTGTPSSNCDSYDIQEAYLMINFPIYDEPSTFAHDFGYPCEVSASLSQVHGFTKCKVVHFEGIACSEEDRRAIEELLESGVYL